MLWDDEVATVNLMGWDGRTAKGQANQLQKKST